MAYQTARQKIISEYEITGREMRLRTTPIHAVSQFVGTVVDVQTANSVAILKFAPQEVSFLQEGRGDRVALGPIDEKYSMAETNLQKGGSTNGANSMAIEGLSFQRIGYRTIYATGVAGWGTPPTDADTLLAMQGRHPVIDPFGHITPAELQSPFMLQDAVFQGIIKHSSVTLKLDTSGDFELGLLDLLPCSNASSYLDANGVPSKESRFELSEGIVWNSDGQPDSDLELIVKLHRTLIVPISLVTMPGGIAAVAPTDVYVVAMARLHGLSVGPTGEN
jgi:hypothetical protein